MCVGVSTESSAFKFILHNSKIKQTIICYTYRDFHVICLSSGNVMFIFNPLLEVFRSCVQTLAVVKEEKKYIYFLFFRFACLSKIISEQYL